MFQFDYGEIRRKQVSKLDAEGFNSTMMKSEVEKNIHAARQGPVSIRLTMMKSALVVFIALFFIPVFFLFTQEIAPPQSFYVALKASSTQAAAFTN